LSDGGTRQEVDPDSGMNHMAHVATNAIFLLHFALNAKRYGEFDDRQEKGKGNCCDWLDGRVKDLDELFFSLFLFSPNNA
jgi:hypothetical protein